MRVIAGKYKGRRLKTLDGLDVRPTSDRLRETLFNILMPQIEGARVLDLCAGSGAVGIEALSRGAAEVAFVEANRRAVQVIRENLAHCKIETGAYLVPRDALVALKMFAQQQRQFEVVYFDPPYDAALYPSVLRDFARYTNLLAPEGILIAEHRRQHPLAAAYGDLRAYRELPQGETQLTFYCYEPGDPAAPPTSTLATDTLSEPTSPQSSIPI